MSKYAIAVSYPANAWHAAIAVISRVSITGYLSRRRS
jgi:hypothetical protein